MPSEQISRTLGYSAGHMFDLVADVERYPEFVPGCRSLRVLRRKHNGELESLSAEMVVGHKLITERFVCQVSLDRSNLAIDVDFVEGPFHKLMNEWRFRPLEPKRCEVDFSIDFELKSRGLGIIVGALFDRVFLRFVDAFEARADALARQALTGRQAPA